ncbi:hypothetical protein BH24CHL6_BH24CHL6_01680 [soil metagenome]
MGAFPITITVVDIERIDFDLSLRGPLDFSLSLAPFGRWGDDFIDRWDGQRLLRVTPLREAMPLPYRAIALGSVGQPRLYVTAELTASAEEQELAQAIRSCFVTDPEGLAELARRDSAVARLAQQYPGLAAVLVPDPLTALVRSVSAQQVNLRWAAEVRRRIAHGFGRRHAIEGEAVFSIDAQALASATEGDLRALQLTGAKARSVIACARAAVEAAAGASRPRAAGG